MSDVIDISIYEGLDKQLAKLGLVKGLTTKTELPKVEYIKTGCMSLDNCLGGLVRGRIYEIYGPYGSCKSSLALFLCRVIQQRGQVVMWVDAEGCFTEEYAIANGVDMDKLLLIRPESMNQALEALRIASKSEDIAMAVTDSVAALVPADELEKDVGAGMLATRARLLSSVLPQIVTNSAKSGCIQIFLNQVRSANLGGLTRR